MGHDGMLYSLPSREIIADSIETMMNAHKLDALLCIPNCDKIVPGMIMGALRVDVPTVFVSGGPMRAGHLRDGTAIDLATAFEAVGKRARGQITDEELREIECSACPGAGSCAGMFTANSMNVLCEAMGIALPGNGTAPALTPEREELVRRAARRSVEIAKGGPGMQEMLAPTSLIMGMGAPGSAWPRPAPPGSASAGPRPSVRTAPRCCASGTRGSPGARSQRTWAAPSGRRG